MPIYEYRCASCGHQQEFLQKVSDAPQTVCPRCGEASLAKMLTAAGFQLKGSGWYATDFRNKGAPPAKAADGAKPEAGSAKAEGSGEAKKESGGGEAKPESGSGEVKKESGGGAGGAAKTGP
jgi:putative FmdB family regulatory protein